MHKLRKPLGPWLTQACKHQKWSFHLDGTTMDLIPQQTEEGIFLVHQQCHSARVYSRTYNVTFTRPQHLIPVSLHKTSTKFYEITGYPWTGGVPRTFGKYCGSQPRLLSHTQHFSHTSKSFLEQAMRVKRGISITIH